MSLSDPLQPSALSTDLAYRLRLAQLHEALGIGAIYCQREVFFEPETLVAAGADAFGRPQQLTPAAFAAWSAMRDAAATEGILLQLISAFRSVDYQCGLIRRKLDRGQTIEDILTVNAAPGLSEHHTGRAIDIGTIDSPPLEEVFEETPAFCWLQEHAGAFGFRLSYPRGNTTGICYEPWHWCFVSKET